MDSAEAKVRHNAFQQFSQIVSADSSPGSDPSRLAESIEEELFNLYHDVSVDYKRKCRCLIFNLTHNEGLKKAVQQGIISPKRLVNMHPWEMADEHLKEERRKVLEHTTEMVELDEKPLEEVRYVAGQWLPTLEAESVERDHIHH